MKIRIDPDFFALIPTLAPEEYRQLEANLIQDGCRDPLVVWNGLLLDGHNRKEICDGLGLEYTTTEVELPDREAAKAWIITNQFGRRNLSPYQKAELALKLEPLIAARAKENERLSPGPKGFPTLGNLSRQADLEVLGAGIVRCGVCDRLYDSTKWDIKITGQCPYCWRDGGKPHAPTIDTHGELARISGLSRGTIHKAKVISERAPEEAKQRLRRNETSIDHEYQQLKKAERREEVVSEIQASVPLGKFHVLVVDPPWPVQKIERDVRPNQSGYDYPTLTLEEIIECSFEGRTIPDLAADHAHLFLWTTHRFLPDAFEIMRQWDFRYVCTMVWHKSGGFQPIGLPQYNCEFALYGRRGAAAFEDTKDFFCCFAGLRQEHSRKPETFYELVRRVTLEPRIDIFSREKHEGFSQLGNQIEKFAESI